MPKPLHRLYVQRFSACTERNRKKLFMKTILLLEDDENLNRGISLRLEKEGYRVLPAFHISQARRLFHENEVSLIISDITLPDGSGLDFGREVRKDVYKRQRSSSLHTANRLLFSRLSIRRTFPCFSLAS